MAFFRDPAIGVTAKRVHKGMALQRSEYGVTDWGVGVTVT